MTDDFEIISPIEPVATAPQRTAYSGLALWFMIVGGTLFIMFALAALIFTVRGLIDDGGVAERLSGIPLYLFVGSFGMVPGALLYIWGRTLRRHGPSRVLAIALPIFALPLIGLSVFVSRFDGLLFAGLMGLCAAALLAVSVVIWRASTGSS